MKNLFRKYSPPGTNVSIELTDYLCSLAVMLFIGTVIFMSRFVRTLNDLYTYRYGAKIAIEGARMADINMLLRHSMCGIWIVFGLCLTCAVKYYMSFYRESKSIYVMKRIKDPKELHIHCLTMQLLGMAAAAALAVLTAGIFTLIYYRVSPEWALPPREALDIMGALL